MRTKAMLLAAALTAVGSAAVMAQTNVYSLNAVGYVNVTLYPGFTMVADQLQSGTNTIANLLPNTGGAFNHFVVYKWTGSGFQSDTGSSLSPSGWQNGGTITLNPGEAAWVKNPGTAPVTNTFVGTVPQGSLTVNIAGNGAFSMISSVVPQGGDLVTGLGFTNFNNKDTIYVYNSQTTNYSTYTYSTLNGFGTAGDPQVQVGQGFWYHTAAGAPAIVWSRTFSVNQ